MSIPLSAILTGLFMLIATSAIELGFRNERLEAIFLRRWYRRLVKTGQLSMSNFWKEASALLYGEKKNPAPLLKMLPGSLAILAGIGFQSLEAVVIGLLGFVIGKLVGQVVRPNKHKELSTSLTRAEIWQRKLQTTVIKALVHIQGPKAEEKLESWTQDFQSPLSAVVLEEMARNGSSWMLPILQDGINHPVETVRKKVLQGFIRSDLPEFRQEIPLFLKDFSPDLRQTALLELRSLTYQEAHPHYQRALSDEDPGVRSTAGKIAHEFEQRRLKEAIQNLAQISDKKEVEVKTDWLFSQIGTLRGHILSAVSMALIRAEETPEVGAELIIKLTEAPLGDLIPTVIAWLGRFSDADSAKALLRVLAEDKAEYRKAAIQGLKDKTQLDVGLVKAGIKTGNAHYRRSIFALVYRFDAEDLFEIFLALMRDPELDIRQHTVRVVSRLNNFPRKIALLKNLLHDKSLPIRQEVYKALEENLGMEAVPMLLETRERILMNFKPSLMGKGVKSELETTELLIRKILIAEETDFRGLEHFLCMNCLTRPRIVDWHKLKVPQCRRCGKIETMQGSISQVFGYIGPNWEETRLKNTVFSIDLWEAKTRKAYFADLDKLEVLSGLKDADWAVNAVVEVLLNGAPNGVMKVKTEIADDVELSANSQRIIARIKA